MTKGKVVLVPFPFDDLSTMTVTTSIITRELGEIAPAMRNEVDDKLRCLFQLS